MVVNVKSFFGVNARTVSGTRLGKVQSMSIDQDTGKLALIHIQPRGMAHLLENELFVAWSDIISMTEEEVVVRDGVVPIQSSVLASEVGRPTST